MDLRVVVPNVASSSSEGILSTVTTGETSQRTDDTTAAGTSPTTGPAPDPTRHPAAVLWDMDGTLVDTEPYWIETEYAIAERYGKTWSQEQALHMVGWDLLDSGAFIKDQLDLDLTPARIVDLLLDGVVERVRRTVPWRPGARELLADLRAAGVPCALVTMSYQRFVEPILEQLPADTFAAIVTGDTVENGKPHPEPYLTAARLLGVEATDCVAIEDSGTGAASAEAAGTLVLCVPNHVDVPPGERRVFADTLTGLSAADIARLAPGVRIPGSDGPTG